MVPRRQPRLVLLNGPPGIGKSTLARRYVADRPLSFCLDIDGFRRLIGHWEQRQEASGLLARSMSLAMAHTHLGRGHDVVVPQYVARPEFIEQLADAAWASAARFFEVYLTDDKLSALDRFHRRQHDPGVAQHHAEATRAIGGAQALADMFDRIEALRASRPYGLVVHTQAGEVDAAYAALTAALDGAASEAGAWHTAPPT